MEKKIEIVLTSTDEVTRHSIVTHGEIALFEILGLLRYYEKQVWMDIMKGSKNITPEPPSKSQDTEPEI